MFVILYVYSVSISVIKTNNHKTQNIYINIVKRFHDEKKPKKKK